MDHNTTWLDTLENIEDCIWLYIICILVGMFFGMASIELNN